MHFETLAIHDGQAPDPHTGSVTVPVYQTSTFGRDSLDHRSEFFYSRIGNPTRQALEAALALLENGKYALAFASGVAATMAALQVLKPGDHIVAGNDIYGGSYRIFEQLLRPWGVTTSYTECESTESYAACITPATKLIWIETPSNPLLQLSDIRALASLAKERGFLLAVDNTFASPYFQRPLELRRHCRTQHHQISWWPQRCYRRRRGDVRHSDTHHHQKLSGCSGSRARPLGLLADSARFEDAENSHEGA